MKTYLIEQGAVATLALPGAVVGAWLGGWSPTAIALACLGVAGEVYAQKLSGYAERKLEALPGKQAELSCYAQIKRAAWVFWGLQAAIQIVRAASAWQLLAWVPLLVWRREYKAIRAAIRRWKR